MFERVIPQRRLGAALIGVTLALSGAFSQAQDVVHDAEYYVLKAQHGERWAAEDRSLDAKLAELRDEFMAELYQELFRPGEAAGAGH